MVDRRPNACVSCASNKTRYSHTGPKLGLPFRPPAVGNSYVSRAMLKHPPRETSRRGTLKLSRRRCDSISSLYFGTPTFFSAAAGTRRARICHVLDTTRGMVPRRILIGPIAYFNPFRYEDAIALSCLVLARPTPATADCAIVIYPEALDEIDATHLGNFYSIHESFIFFLTETSILYNIII